MLGLESPLTGFQATQASITGFSSTYFAVLGLRLLQAEVQLIFRLFLWHKIWYEDKLQQTWHMEKDLQMPNSKSTHANGHLLTLILSVTSCT